MLATRERSATVYDPAHRLTDVTNPGLEQTTFDYDPVGNNLSKSLANGTLITMTYDVANHMYGVLNKDNTSATISEYQYGFDNVGNRTSVDEIGVQYSNWTYDGINQLGSDLYFDGYGWAHLTVPQWRFMSADMWDALPVDVLAIYSYTYLYDPAGNRLTQTGQLAGTRVTSVYDGANRLPRSDLDADRTTYTYDPNGNLLTIEEPTGDITSHTWDCENRMVQVESPSGDVTTYTYNADGLRMSTDDGTDFRKHIYDGNNSLREVDDTGAIKVDVTYDPKSFAEVLSLDVDGTPSFPTFDGTGNVTKLNDLSGTLLDDYVYDAFGVPRPSTVTTDSPQRYKGLFRAYQTIGDFVSMLYRDEYTQLNRFLSEDPAERDNNLYRVCGNNPVNREDKSGLGEFQQSGSLEEGVTRSDWYYVISGFFGSRTYIGSYDSTTGMIEREVEVDGKIQDCRVDSKLVTALLTEEGPTELDTWSKSEWDVWFEVKYHLQRPLTKRRKRTGIILDTSLEYRQDTDKAE